MRLDCKRCEEKVDSGFIIHPKCFKYYINKIKRLEKKIKKLESTKGTVTMVGFDL